MHTLEEAKANQQKINTCREITGIAFENKQASTKKGIGDILQASEQDEPITKAFFYDFLTSYFLSRITCREVMALMNVRRSAAYMKIQEVRDFFDKEPWQIVTKNEFFFYWYDIFIDED